jgi:heme/copper-type cytochrome/quinol oxidase subunit 4
LLVNEEASRMKNRYYTIAMPGGLILTVLGLCLLMPSLFEIVDIIFLWIALSTIGIPTILASILFYYLDKTSSTKVNALALAITLIVLTIPSTLIFIDSWLYFYPSDGPGLGYMGIFYIVSAPVWLPLIICWSWWSTRDAIQTH